MANILDSPRIARQVEALRVNCPEMVPVDCDTSFIQIAYGDDLADDIPPSSLSVRAYVVGLELLGYRFYVASDHNGRGLYIREPEHTLHKAWADRSLSLITSFRGAGAKHVSDDVIGFLLERDGAPTLDRTAKRTA